MTSDLVITTLDQMNTKDNDPRCLISCFEPAKVAAVRMRLEQDESDIKAVVRIFDVLGNRTRLRILLTLASEELCVCDIAHVLNLSISAASHQLRALHDREWLRMRNDGKMVYYRTDPQKIKHLLSVTNAFLEERIA
ncbi:MULTISPECIES: ArsR/SmtB family transcription factor [Acidithiobacillaceae]|nr:MULTISPECIES: metalloregulator ArsR/SmtB family transcription factor [Acidithiobacillaceae]